MRCGCGACGAFMAHAEGESMGCVCPDCGRRCRACLGAGAVVRPEDLHTLAALDWVARDVAICAEGGAPGGEGEP